MVDLIATILWAADMQSDSANEHTAPAAADIGDDATCNREPIHLSSAIQPHGVLLVVRTEGRVVLQASRNAAAAIGSGEPLQGRPMRDFVDPAFANIIERLDVEAVESPTYVGLIRSRDGAGWSVLVHRNPGDPTALIVELEPASGSDSVSFRLLPPLIRSSTGRLSAAGSVEEAWRMAAEEVARLNRYNRVMIYRFEPDWSGQVVAECKADDLESWMSLRYPASDIPAQARAMYVHSRIRLVSDIHYTPVPIEPATNPYTGKPVDLTFATLRSVSPIHLEYLKNMGIGASMSVSIVRDGALWGMILCHHRTPRPLSFEVLAACEVVAEVLALQMPAKERARATEQMQRARMINPRLLEKMATATDFVSGLVDAPDDLLALAHATGAAVVMRGRVRTVGVTPNESEISAIVDWLSETQSLDLFSSDQLSKVYPPALNFKASACGLLAATISRVEHSYLLWFRPEVFRTLNWAGDPKKPSEFTAAGMVVRPRANFEVWKQTLRAHSEAWEQADFDAVGELRGSVVGIVLRQAEARAKLAADLQQSNKELEAFSYSVSHDLRAPFRHILGFSDLLQKRNEKLDETSKRYVRTIADSAKFAGTLVDGLLSFSQMGRASLRIVYVDMNLLVADVWREVVAAESGEHAVQWTAGDLPSVYGDLLMLRLALRNLLANAVKYSAKRGQPVIEIGAQPSESNRKSAGAENANQKYATFFVRDNGVGFDPAFVDKLFGVFQRLHRTEDFEGTGIGLANVKRIIERHGGRVWAESEVDHGATFFFTLPRDRTMHSKPD